MLEWRKTSTDPMQVLIRVEKRHSKKGVFDETAKSVFLDTMRDKNGLVRVEDIPFAVEEVIREGKYIMGKHRMPVSAFQLISGIESGRFDFNQEYISGLRRQRIWQQSLRNNTFVGRLKHRIPFMRSQGIL